jgi:hypothetical protein
VWMVSYHSASCGPLFLIICYHFHCVPDFIIPFTRSLAVFLCLACTRARAHTHMHIHVHIHTDTELPITWSLFITQSWCVGCKVLLHSKKPFRKLNNSMYLLSTYILYLSRQVGKIVKSDCVLLKSHNNGYCTWTHMYSSDNISPKSS